MTDVVTEPRRRSVRDLPRITALDILTVYIISVYAVPSSLTLAAAPAIGRPSNLLGLGCFGWWLLHNTLRSRPRERPQQLVRIALTLFVLAVLVSYAVANTAGLPSIERSTSDTALIRLVSWIGPALVAMDGVQTKQDFLTLVRRIAFAGTAVTTLGLAQFFTGQSWIDWITLPGFQFEDLSLGDRGGFVRASGTSAHTLEFATVVSAALPLSLNAALFAHRGGTLRRWYGPAAILLSSLLAVSRSALIGAFIGIVQLVPTWPHRLRSRMAIAGVVLLGVVYVTIPGMIGTLRGMFQSDSSTDSRVDSWDTAFEIAQGYPLVGRGFGTFLPTYRILDNGYLGLLIEVGTIGLAAFLGMILTAAIAPLVVARGLDDVVLQTQVRAVSASMMTVAVLVAFFDALSFSQAASTIFLLVGCCGAAHNIARAERELQLV